MKAQETEKVLKYVHIFTNLNRTFSSHKETFGA
jgi:hypothetical protein